MAKTESSPHSRYGVWRRTAVNIGVCFIGDTENVVLSTETAVRCKSSSDMTAPEGLCGNSTTKAVSFEAHLRERPRSKDIISVKGHRIRRGTCKNSASVVCRVARIRKDDVIVFGLRIDHQAACERHLLWRQTAARHGRSGHTQAHSAF